MPMTLGKRGELLIKSYEGYSSKAYLPTPDDVLTIGFGHTRNVKMGDTCTTEQAEEWFKQDISSAVQAVNKFKFNLTQAMFDALVSLVFNVGPGALKPAKVPTLKQSDMGSTIWTALSGYGRNGDPDYYAACAGFFLWRKQNKKDLLGLARRRAKEMVLFLEDGLP